MDQYDVLGNVKNSGYEMLAASYEEFLQKKSPDELVRESMKTDIKALKIAARLSKEEQIALFSTGMYNDLCREYLKRAISGAGADEKMVEAALDELGWLFDTATPAILKDSAP